MAIQIVVAVDYCISRVGITEMLRRDANLEVIAEAGDGKQAVTICQSLRPRVLILALHRPAWAALAVARLLQSEPDPPSVLFVGDHADPHLTRTALDAGGSGYIVASASQQDLIEAIYQLVAGRLVLPELVNDSIDAPATLGPRERQILWQVAQGLTNKAIARRHGISVRTVGNHLQHTFQKLGASNRVEAILRARQYGILPAD
jgi:DNA-binding NarL/FixJ family response regulator